MAWGSFDLLMWSAIVASSDHLLDVVVLCEECCLVLCVDILWDDHVIEAWCSHARNEGKSQKLEWDLHSQVDAQLLEHASWGRWSEEEQMRHRYPDDMYRGIQTTYIGVSRRHRGIQTTERWIVAASDDLRARWERARSDICRLRWLKSQVTVRWGGGDATDLEPHRHVCCSDWEREQAQFVKQFRNQFCAPFLFNTFEVPVLNASTISTFLLPQSLTNC